ncbi:hypothetical protein E0H93_34795 [Rhizobium leguminosarum bv. viciae]|uniref:hypothetical protein n=1 Tax=Rhizobium leguminosarum TaxID=384 RepID=UPI001038CE68|nr:hypothetical protein [Rhizobium leguminosarum]MBY5530203.1 hypothetical protein [Rhizobium leguminosarum]TBY30674.1 hypothetical protein E0H55_20545 [Rhizobium leguminosarum bv. viciae]TBY35716.1 hypothetical protein E0H60_22840 [Rhizobium leguminosarum bv. viciae]TCA94806.1 hypothetical protein E0H93_34795 [Rhizobium leguminosarum bv. viciae]
MTSTLIACSNFGGCPVAGEPLWDERIGACHRCGKMLASPHGVAVQSPAASIQEGFPVEIPVDVHIGNGCAKGKELWLEINGKRHGESITDPVPGQTVFKISDGLHGGLYPLRAVLKTSDGRTTMSDQRLLFVNSEPLLFAPLIWALLLVLLVCVSASLGWFGKPLFGWASPPSLGYLVDGISVVSALLIGALLLNLGLRERALAAGQRSIVRHQKLKGDTRSDKVLNRMGDMAASSAALIIIGALPFCFALAYLVGIVSGNQQPWAVMAVLIAVGAVIVAVFWTMLASMTRRLASKLRRRTISPASEDAGPTSPIISAPKPGVLPATREQPAEEGKTS